MAVGEAGAGVCQRFAWEYPAVGWIGILLVFVPLSCFLRLVFFVSFFHCFLSAFCCFALLCSVTAFFPHGAMVPQRRRRV